MDLKILSATKREGEVWFFMLIAWFLTVFFFHKRSQLIGLTFNNSFAVECCLQVSHQGMTMWLRVAMMGKTQLIITSYSVVFSGSLFLFDMKQVKEEEY